MCASKHTHTHTHTLHFLLPEHNRKEYNQLSFPLQFTARKRFKFRNARLIHSRCSIGIYYIEKEDTLVRSRSQHSSRSLTKGYSGLCPTIFIPLSFFPPRRTKKHSHHSPICLSFMRFLCIIFDVSCFCHYIYLLYLLACLFFILTAKAAQNCR